MIFRKKQVCMYCKIQKPKEIKSKEFIGWVCQECKHIICSQCVKDLQTVKRELTCIYIDWLHKKETVEFAPSIFFRFKEKFIDILVRIKDWLNKPDPIIMDKDAFYGQLERASTLGDTDIPQTVISEGTTESYDDWHISKIPNLWGFNIYATKTVSGAAVLSGKDLFVSQDDYNLLRSQAPVNSKIFKQWIRDLGIK